MWIKIFRISNLRCVLDTLTHNRESVSRKQICVCVRQHIQSEKPNWIGRVGNPISLYTLQNYGSDTEPTEWLPVSLEGYFSLVQLEIFMHPYPTLVRHYLNLLPNQVPNQSFCFSMGLHTHKWFHSKLFIKVLIFISSFSTDIFDTDLTQWVI